MNKDVEKVKEILMGKLDDYYQGDEESVAHQIVAALDEPQVDSEGLLADEVIREIRKPMSGSNNKGSLGWNEVGKLIAKAQLAADNARWQRKVEELIFRYEDYIQLLGGEIEELIPLAIAHGWKSTRAEGGEKCREKIKSLKSKIGGGE